MIFAAGWTVLLGFLLIPARSSEGIKNNKCRLPTDPTEVQDEVAPRIHPKVYSLDVES
jgi:hypothetical protein